MESGYPPQSIMYTSPRSLHLLVEITLIDEQSPHVLTSWLNGSPDRTDIKAMKHLGFGTRSA